MELVYKHRKIKTWKTGALKVVLSQGKCDIDSTGRYSSTRLPTLRLSFPFELEDEDKFHIGNEMCVTRQSVNLDAPLPSTPKGYLKFMNGHVETELERINEQAIQPWLRICQQHHTRCKSPPQHVFLSYPTRLVWVGDTADDEVKLVETGEECPPYLILSYCWGKSNDSAKTTETNYAERTQAIRTSKLPKTIRDAIQLTRAMGEKYIWIDAMCIKQTDKDHTGDWATEAPKVGDYYANAKCLISALSAAESGEGFLGERLAWRYAQRYSLITHGMTFCKSERVCFFASAPEQNFESDTEGWQPLTERGWCLQERILCPRRLLWTRNGLFWQCNTVYASEEEALCSKLPPANDQPMRQPRVNKILLEDKIDVIGVAWTLLVEEYSSRKFTMESDRLLAIHGIASRLARQHNAVYCAGIFGSRLVNGLMWQCQVSNDVILKKAKNRSWVGIGAILLQKFKSVHETLECRGPKREGEDSDFSSLSGQFQDFPTWSWASASGEVSWPWTFGACQGPGCFVNLVRFPPDTLNPDFTEMPSRELLIRAPLVKFFLNGHHRFKRLETLGATGLWENLDLGDVEFIELRVTNYTYTELKRDSVLLAAILLQKKSNDVYGIILKKLTMRNNEVYMRAGIFWIPVWNEARYARNGNLYKPTSLMFVSTMLNPTQQAAKQTSVSNNLSPSPSSTMEAKVAGEWLVNLYSEEASNRNRDQYPTPLEQLKFDEFFIHHGSSPIFKKYHVEAIRKCLSKEIKPEYRNVKELIAKGETKKLFVGENDVLQVAIQRARIDPDSEQQGMSPAQFNPELQKMVKLLIDHGAKVNYLSTLQKRVVPEQVIKARQASGIPIEDEENVNLLQVTLDALISPQRVWDMTWVGWPPGVNYNRPLWKMWINASWGGIIHRLISEGLSYEKDDPGLVMLLHITSYQGDRDEVVDILEYGVPANIPNPRIINGGQGEGTMFGTAMLAAAAGLHMEVIETLIAHGEDPGLKRLCAFDRGAVSKEFTPVEIAIAVSDRDLDLSRFLQAFVTKAKNLPDCDYQAVLTWCVESDELDFAKDLLERGVRLDQVPLDTKSVGMAQLLTSNGIKLNPTPLQQKALRNKHLDLLRWCVDEYGPKLPSDPVSWGRTGL
ncbi:unnamed protein product [Fusarium equiseti]|uniref:Heterokaryon incompatibility domain-containing protein n=1 Tax=Fusarium equiseti TaxID=61235 RepID=A0A8J2ILI1_FUSEQ|nr:unnamed protein product [Fusarium equiseti]